MNPSIFRKHRRSDRSTGLVVSTLGLALLLLGLCVIAEVMADAPVQAGSKPAVGCLPSGDGFLRARLSGAINTELDWADGSIECTGSIRPADGGLRLRFRHLDKDGHALVFVFGITGLREGVAGKALPVNVTVIREGSGDFFATQGDQRCTIDQVAQRPLAGIPRRQRSYRVAASGFCTQPARALTGEGAILITRFDYAGRVDFESDDPPQSPKKSE